MTDSISNTLSPHLTRMSGLMPLIWRNEMRTICSLTTCLLAQYSRPRRGSISAHTVANGTQPRIGWFSSFRPISVYISITTLWRNTLLRFFTLTTSLRLEHTNHGNQALVRHFSHLPRIFKPPHKNHLGCHLRQWVNRFFVTPPLSRSNRQIFFNSGNVGEGFRRYLLRAVVVKCFSNFLRG